jgi:hypothetical protein
MNPKRLMSRACRYAQTCVCLLFAVATLTAGSWAQSWPPGKLSSTYKMTGTYAPCNTVIYYFYWTYTDTSGKVHSFSGSSQMIVMVKGYAPNGLYCLGSISYIPLDEYSSDGKGYYSQARGPSATLSITATIFPKYHILSLLYDAPGNQSYNGFNDTTFYGTTNSIGNSFSSGITFTFTASGGFFGIGGGSSSSVGFTQGYGTTNSFTDTITSGQGLVLDSTRNPIDHTNDTFWVWLNPLVSVTQTGPSTATYAVSPPSGQVMDAVRVSVAQLQNPSTIPLSILEPITINGVVYPGLSNLCAHPLPPSQCTQANACGCVPGDFNQPNGILSQDPIISITGNTPPSNADSKRYIFLNPQPSPQPFLEYGTPDTITLTDQQQSSQMQTETTQYQTSYSTTFGSSVHAFPVDWTLQEKITNTFTWTQTIGLTNFSGTSHQMILYLKTSTPDCAEPIDVYEDYNYHTFVASVASTPPPACDSN